MLSHTMQGIKADAEQFLTSDVHEIATDVQLQYIALLLIVLTLLTDVLLQSFDAIVRTAASSWQEKARRQSLILIDERNPLEEPMPIYVFSTRSVST